MSKRDEKVKNTEKRLKEKEKMDTETQQSIAVTNMKKETKGQKPVNKERPKYLIGSKVPV